MSGTVAVLIPTWNQVRELLVQAVDSARAAHADQIVIADDGSDPPVWNQWDDDPRVEIHHFPHRGVSSVLNAGIRHVWCDYTASLASDDTMNPARLHLQRSHLDSARASAIFSAYRIASGENAGDIVRYRHPLSQLRYRLRRDNQIYGPTRMVRTELFRETPWDEGLVWCGDWDWHNRIADRVPWHYVDHVLVNRGVYVHGFWADARRNARAYAAERAKVHRRWNG